ncbi:MAG: hypothetical protein AAGA55_10100, partial [Planctomycetota bacterium]
MSGSSMFGLRGAAALGLVAVISSGTTSMGSDEPGTIVRSGVEVYLPPAAEESGYLVTGAEGLLPPLGHAPASGHGVVVWGDRWADLYDHQEDGLYLYRDFLDAMGFDPLTDHALEWPTQPDGTRVPYLGVTSFSALFGHSLSRAYHNAYNANENAVGESDLGYPLYGFPRVGPSGDVQIPPDLPPVAQTIAGSNSPLVPATVAGVARKMYSTRETVAGELDLLTGQPLLRDVDFEIPFGGAVFRRIRTYSEPSQIGLEEDESFYNYGSELRVRTPGWHGDGWMSSEMPMFLIDSAAFNTDVVVRDGRVTEARCIFSPDAHHSIPFVRQVSPAASGQGNAGEYNVDYVAPTWFDALLTHTGGDWNNERRDWDVYPTEFRVILNKRSVTYVIKPVYEDVSPWEQRLPTNEGGVPGPDFEIGGFGNAYYGLVTKIQDRAGNRVEISYAGGHEPFDSSAMWRKIVPGTDPEIEADYLQYTQQRGWYKGMVEHIKLYPAGESEAAWTLLYTYRAFAAARQKLREWNFWDRRSFAPALHSILAYESDLDTDSIQRDLILKCHEIPDLTGCDPVLPDPPVGEDETTGTMIDAANIDAALDGNSSPAIDRVPLGSSPGQGRLGMDTPPFQELLLDDPTDACDTPFLPVPIKTGYANQFDYQDSVIGPAGEGPDDAAWARLPSGWTYQARFSYAPPAQYDAGLGHTIDVDY